MLGKRFDIWMWSIATIFWFINAVIRFVEHDIKHGSEALLLSILSGLLLMHKLDEKE